MISPPTYEKEMLSNQHTLVIDGKGDEDVSKERAFDLNEFNHCHSLELSAKEFEELRQSFCNNIMSRDQVVEDAITGKQQDIEKQVLQLGIGKEMTLKDYRLPGAWKDVKQISDFGHLVAKRIQKCVP